MLISSIDLPDNILEAKGTEAGQIQRRFRQLRNAFGERSVLLVRSGSSSFLDPLSDQTAQQIGNRLGPLSQLPIRFTSYHDSYQMWWENLRDKDGILQLNPEELLPSKQIEDGGAT